MQKLLKAWYFMNRMYKYDMECFSKTLILNPDLQKIRISINFSLNFKLQTHNNMYGHNKITHNNMYKVLQRVTCVVCATSKNLRYM